MIENDVQAREIPELFGLVDFAREIEFDPRKLGVYYRRNKLPAPATRIGKRPAWTREQVEKYREEYAVFLQDKSRKREIRLSKRRKKAE